MRRRLTAHIAVVALMAIVVAVLGWRLLQEDRRLQSQEIGERLETSADAAAVEVRDAVDEIRARLAAFADGEAPTLPEGAAWAENLPADAFVVRFDREGVSAWPPGRLLFSPVEAPAQPTSVAAFTEGELLEFRESNPAAAAEHFARLSESDDRKIQAGALLRLARNLRKAGRPDEALIAYDRLLECGDVTLEGRPAALLALQGRMATLEEIGDQAATARAAADLRDRLKHSDWVISRATFEHYWSVTAQALGAGAGPDGEGAAVEAPALAGPLAVEALWIDWQAGRSPGELPVPVDEGVSLIVGLPGDGSWVGLVAGSGFVEAALIEPIAPSLERQGAKLLLLDREGRRIDSSAAPAGDASADQRSGPIARRTAAETGLPWTLHVSSVDLNEELALLAGRRRLLAAGLVVMAVLVVAGGVLSVQSVRRELAVADLKSSLVSAVSHEFRTPLTLLRQTTEALADGRVDDADTRRRYYDRQLRATDRLQRLVEGMLDFGRAEAGAFELAAEPIDFGTWVRDVCDAFNSEAEGETPVRLDVQTAGTELRADRDALTRALWNLLDNAVKYSAGGSPVDVTTRAESRFAAVEVGDRGLGVPAREHDAIFEKFARGSDAAGRAQGTGLGLAMAREIARAHGGDVTVKDRAGGGSTFTLSVPLENEP